jgi:hypothetical protein
MILLAKLFSVMWLLFKIIALAACGSVFVRFMFLVLFSHVWDKDRSQK